MKAKLNSAYYSGKILSEEFIEFYNELKDKEFEVEKHGDFLWTVVGDKTVPKWKFLEIQLIFLKD